MRPSLLNILFALTGLHRHDRGAEQAFISIASELVKTNDSVTLLIGSGQGSERQYRIVFCELLVSVGRDSALPLSTWTEGRMCCYGELTFWTGLPSTLQAGRLRHSCHLRLSIYQLDALGGPSCGAESRATCL